MALPSPYRTLPIEKRLALVTNDLRTSKSSRDAYIMRLVSKGGGFRPETLRKWKIEQLASEIVRRKLETLQDEVGMLQTLYVEMEPQIQVDFLDAAGVQHTNGHIPEDMAVPFADQHTVLKAAMALREKHGEDGERYLRTIALYNGEAWPGLPELLMVSNGDVRG
jgi:hypothetical protein